MSPSTSFQALHATGITRRAWLLLGFFVLAQHPCYFHMPIGLTLKYTKRKAQVALLGEGGWGKTMRSTSYNVRTKGVARRELHSPVRKPMRSQNANR